MAIYWLLPFLVFLGLGPHLLRKINRKFINVPAIIFGPTAALAAFLFCCAIATGPLDGIPKIQDEINYFFQATILNSGSFSVNSHPLADFFQYRFFVNDGKMYSLFQPGWPLLLGLGQRLGAPWIMGPIMGGLSVLFFFGIARRLFGESVGRWSVMVLVGCTTFLFQSASMMAHGPALAFCLIAFYGCVRGFENGQSRWFLLAGLSAGALFSIRAATTVALTLPVTLTGLFMVFQKKIHPKNVLFLILGFLPGALFQAFYNLSLSGSLFTFPQDHYFNLTEATKNCHRLGIGDGIGCRYEHGPDLGKNGFTFRRAIEVTRIRLESFRFDLFGLGFGALFVFLPWLNRSAKAKYLILAMPISLMSVYFFYYYHAGSRYYFESIPFCILLVVLGGKCVLETIRDPEDKHADSLEKKSETKMEALKERFVYAFVLTAFFTAVAFNLNVKLPTKWKQYLGYWKHHKNVASAILKADLKNAVILVPPVSRMYWTGFWLNNANLDGEYIVALDQGNAVNTQLATYYPEREFYKINHRGKLRKIRLSPNPKKITIEAETKFPVPIRKEGYALAQNMRPWKIPGSQLLFEAKTSGAFMTFNQYIFEDGNYQVSAVFGNGPDYGIFNIEIGGKPLLPFYDGFSKKVEMKKWKSTSSIKLKKGLSSITLRVNAKNAASKSFVAGIDKIVLEKID